MRHGSLIERDKMSAPPKEVVLILPLAEAQALVDMADAACKAQPRKTTWKKLLKELEQLECWL